MVRDLLIYYAGDKMKFIALVFLLFVLSSQAEYAMASPSADLPLCPRIAIPMGSLVIGGANTEVPLLIIYPRSFPANYSGCAYAWMGNDAELYSIARINKGSVAEGVISDYIMPSMVYCPSGESKENPSLCESFKQFWGDAIENAPAGNSAPEHDKPGSTMVRL
jgi:hypothetical protein